MRKDKAKQISDTGKMDGVSEAFERMADTSDKAAENTQFGRDFHFSDVAVGVAKATTKAGVEIKRAFDKEKAVSEGLKIDQMITSKMNEISKLPLEERKDKIQELSADIGKELSKFDGISPDIRAKAINAATQNANSKVNGLLKDTLRELSDLKKQRIETSLTRFENEAMNSPESYLAMPGKKLNEIAVTNAPYIEGEAAWGRMDKATQRALYRGALNGLKNKENITEVDKWLKDERVKKALSPAEYRSFKMWADKERTPKARTVRLDRHIDSAIRQGQFQNLKVQVAGSKDLEKDKSPEVAMKAQMARLFTGRVTKVFETKDSKGLNYKDILDDLRKKVGYHIGHPEEEKYEIRVKQFNKAFMADRAQFILDNVEGATKLTPDKFKDTYGYYPVTRAEAFKYYGKLSGVMQGGGYSNLRNFIDQTAKSTEGGKDYLMDKIEKGMHLRLQEAKGKEKLRAQIELWVLDKALSQEKPLPSDAKTNDFVKMILSNDPITQRMIQFPNDSNLADAESLNDAQTLKGTLDDDEYSAILNLAIIETKTEAWREAEPDERKSPGFVDHKAKKKLKEKLKEIKEKKFGKEESDGDIVLKKNRIGRERSSFHLKSFQKDRYENGHVNEKSFIKAFPNLKGIMRVHTSKFKGPKEMFTSSNTKYFLEVNDKTGDVDFWYSTGDIERRLRYSDGTPVSRSQEQVLTTGDKALYSIFEGK